MASKAQDDKLIQALARGYTNAESARLAGMSDRTVRRRMQDSSFRRSVADARAAFIEKSAAELAFASQEAVTTLRSLLSAASESVRLSAARAILESSIRFRECAELNDRIQKLEEHAYETPDKSPQKT